MSIREKIELKRRVAKLARCLEDDPILARRVDREESARTVALFLAYARSHQLMPAEAQSLLSDAAHDAPQALDVLDGPSRMKPTSLPGREAHAEGTSDVRRAPHRGRIAGRKD